MRTDLLNLSQPKRSPLPLLHYVFLLDGGTVVHRFTALRGKTAGRRAERYRQRLIHTSPDPG